MQTYWGIVATRPIPTKHCAKYYFHCSNHMDQTTMELYCVGFFLAVCFSQDESYLNEQGTGKDGSWHDNNVKCCLQQSASLGARYIMCDCYCWLYGVASRCRNVCPGLQEPTAK